MAMINQKLSYIVMLFSVLMLFSCATKKAEKVVSIDMDNLPVDSALSLDMKSIIPLESSASSYIKMILSIEYFNNRYYVIDLTSYTVLCFSDEGKFLGKTKVGKGPNELINPFALYPDKANDLLYVYDQRGNAIALFNKDLKMIEKYNIDFYIDYFAVMNNEILAHKSDIYDHEIRLYKSDFKTVKTSFLKGIEYSGGGLGVGRGISIGEKILLIRPFDYNIYEFANDTIETYLKFDFGEHSITKADIDNNRLDISMGRNGERVISLSNLTQSKDFLFFSTYFDRKSHQFIYSKKSGKISTLNQYFSEGTLPKFTIRGTKDGNIFYGLIKPEDLIEFQEKSGKKWVDKTVDLNDNPYLITLEINNEQLPN